MHITYCIITCVLHITLLHAYYILHYLGLHIYCYMNITYYITLHYIYIAKYYITHYIHITYLRHVLLHALGTHAARQPSQCLSASCPHALGKQPTRWHWQPFYARERAVSLRLLPSFTLSLSPSISFSLFLYLHSLGTQAGSKDNDRHCTDPPYDALPIGVCCVYVYRHVNNDRPCTDPPYDALRTCVCVCVCSVCVYI